MEATGSSETSIFLFAFQALLQNCRKRLINFVITLCPPVRPFAWNNSATTGRIFMKFDILVFFENVSRKIKFPENLTRITGTLHKA